MIQYYNVADFLFSIEAEEKHFECLTNYAPFRQSTNDKQPATVSRCTAVKASGCFSCR